MVLELRAASFAARGVGALIDFAAAVVLLVGLGLLLLSGLGDIDPAAASALVLGTVVFVFVALPIGVETLTRGKSLGKLVMGLRIVRDDGGSIRFRQALIRGLLGVFELYMMLGSVAFLVSLFNSPSKRLGDMLAGTYSMRERVAAAPPLIVTTPPQLQPWAGLADIGRMPDPLGRRISAFLTQWAKMTPESRAQLAAALATEAAAYVSPPPPPGTAPDAYLAAVMSERRDRELRRMTAQRERADATARRLYTLPFDQDN
ncbi:RDD family protein [Paenarthrobacter sp. PH39-S1]|uniref:RDD family protein n=1 Tax=Paenarthrobacter sp. PH39-S1 TaxID=3046204 RepID=UPI0024B8CB5E|nr:RDD family protein [Paenarthrobacter sp. PH39-S1]MDJ0356150.1 RDD family protein [Paenarthrobacter sp. PH39-S1]